jgi:hypothetical protein
MAFSGHAPGRSATSNRQQTQQFCDLEGQYRVCSARQASGEGGIGRLQHGEHDAAVVPA